ncbi:MAG: hypothetical protein H7Z14_20525 [Anaerolineae bacterium]|nr:hypothetical protein [Phycisphaerae bacterium]
MNTNRTNASTTLETLELRRLFAASVINQVLMVEGTNGVDNLDVRTDPNNAANVKVSDSVIGTNMGSFAKPSFTRIDVFARDGNDNVLISVPTPCWLFGEAGNDRLDGHEVNDELYGGTGNDRLRGHGGNDAMDGGAGRNRFDGGAGPDFDIVNYQSSTVPISVTFDSPGSIVELTGGNDQLYGGTGADNISGGMGDDRLDGTDFIRIGVDGHSRDVLDGGPGRDTAYFGARPFFGSDDVVTNCEVLIEVINGRINQPFGL